MKVRVVLLLIAVALPAAAQNENRLQRDFRVEMEDLAHDCGKFNFGSLIDCGQVLATAQPFHITGGSLAPQNGFGAGLAFTEHQDLLSEWRLGWNADAVASSNLSWRAGFDLKAYHYSAPQIRPVFPHPGSKPVKLIDDGDAASPLYNLYMQAESLNRLDFYGLGPDSAKTAHSTFAMTETIIGASAILPLRRMPGLSLAGEVNGRFPSLRQGADTALPYTGDLFPIAMTPGLERQSAYFEPSEGIRLVHGLIDDHLRVNYFLQFQQYAAPGDRSYSFRRFNADFNHEIPLHHSVLSPATVRNGPDDCSGSGDGGQQPKAEENRPLGLRSVPCPTAGKTVELVGSVALRLYLSESIANAGSAVPFYFQPTLGGSDIAGNSALASYPDYRFRGPDELLLRGTIEHSLGHWPVGALFSVDGGKIGLRRDDVSFDHLRHTFSGGVTVHAGGLPVVNLLFSWGGPEGHHTSATVSPTLLGGSDRPSLF